MVEETSSSYSAASSLPVELQMMMDTPFETDNDDTSDQQHAQQSQRGMPGRKRQIDSSDDNSSVPQLKKKKGATATTAEGGGVKNIRGRSRLYSSAQSSFVSSSMTLYEEEEVGFEEGMLDTPVNLLISRERSLTKNVRIYEFELYILHC